MFQLFISHGISNAMLLPTVIEYTKSSCVTRLAEIGLYLYQEMKEFFDEEVANKVVSTILNLCRSLKIPNSKTWGIGEKEYQGH